MDYLALIKRPIDNDLNCFIDLFNNALTHQDGLLGQALAHIRQRGGKRMRPMLILLTASNYGRVSDVTQHAAVGLELLHTASLVHDDVVDESGERRGQASVNATYDNKVAVLVGDYILSTALLHVAKTRNDVIVEELAELGRTLASGEILQLTNIRNQDISEDVYYEVIQKKTAVLFASCAALGALSAGADATQVQQAREFGRSLGVMFQIRDDIFDYYDSHEIGKPTGNDMAEGKLTLPVIYALNHTGNEAMLALARKVKEGTVSPDEIGVLVDFAKREGGITYAEQCMEQIAATSRSYIEKTVKPELRPAFTAYLDYVIRRNY